MVSLHIILLEALIALLYKAHFIYYFLADFSKKSASTAKMEDSTYAV